MKKLLGKWFFLSFKFENDSYIETIEVSLFEFFDLDLIFFFI